MHIYKTTNLINGKIYIGQEKGNNINYLGSGKILKLSVKKYGSENFTFEILETLNNSSIKDLLKKETETIIEYNTLCPNGYNLKLENGFRHLTKELSVSISKG